LNHFFPKFWCPKQSSGKIWTNLSLEAEFG
jgi:hypothetical protein